MKSTNQTGTKYTHIFLANGDGAYDFILSVDHRKTHIGLADEVVRAWKSVYGADKIVTVSSNDEPGKRFTHVYIARESNGDYDFLLSLTGDRRDLAPNVIRALEAAGEEVEVVYSDDEPVDVLVFVESDERIPA